LIALEKENLSLKTRIEVLQKGLGLTEEALSNLLKPLVQEKLTEKAFGAERQDLGFILIKRVSDMSPREIISEYIKIVKGKE